MHCLLITLKHNPMAKDWQYQINPFLVASNNSYIKAVRLSVFHDTALANVSTDAFFGPLYTAYHTQH